MTVFVLLCLASRVCYSLNDVFTGRLSREMGRMEVAAWRGVSLGATMAPVLLWVPVEAWGALAQRWPRLALCVALTAICNLLQNQAARWLPFGLRAAIIMAGVATGSTTLGWFILGDTLNPLQIVLCGVVVASAALAARGEHANHEIEPEIGRGAAVAAAASVLMAFNAVIVADLARTTHPLLTAWAWEFGAGLVLVGPLLPRLPRLPPVEHVRRFGRIALAALPTVAGSSLSMVALSLGAIGVWAAVSGTQVLVTAVFGALWHGERVGTRRWVCFAAAAVAVSGLAVVRL